MRLPSTAALTLLLWAGAARAQTPVVTLDAGHGGRDQGQSMRGVRERELALTMSRRVEALLRAQGETPFLTRWDDEFVPLSNRVEQAEKVGSQVFISFHADNNAQRKGRGVMLWVYGQNRTIPKGPPRQPGERILPPPPKDQVAESRRLAELLQRAMRKRGIRVSGYVDRGPFAVLKGPEMASVLIEVGNLRDKHEAALMKDPGFQDKLAQAVAAAVKSYLAEAPAGASSSTGR